MKLGLIGLPKCGKTTVFNALTGLSADVTAYADGKAEPNLASVVVDDDRVTRLSQLYSPKKTTFATVDITDFVGVSAGTDKAAALSPSLLQLLRDCDALAVVLRNFFSDVQSAPDPLGDLHKVEEELILADLIVVENRLERIAKADRIGKKTPALDTERKLMTRLQEALNTTTPIRNLEFNSNENKTLGSFQFLTLKPVMAVLNSAEDNCGDNETCLNEITTRCQVTECAGNFEMELSLLDSDEDRRAFMEDMKISESVRSRLISMAYRVLGYISFFTVGDDEVRAWNLHNGDTAVEAAAAIHTDLAKGFIRAECFSYDDLVEYGSEKAVKEKGKLRLEGKDYVVKDGDILSIRFNV